MNWKGYVQHIQAQTIAQGIRRLQKNRPTPKGWILSILNAQIAINQPTNQPTNHSMHPPPSQHRKPSSPDRQRSHNNLRARRLGRRRPLRILRNDTRLRSAHARQVILIRRRYSAVPARLCRPRYDGLEVVRGVGFHLVEDGFRDGGLEGLEDGGEFGL